MTEPKEYKVTFFDRHGPEGLQHIKALGYGMMVFGLVFGTLISRLGFHWWIPFVALAAGIVVGGMGFWLGEAAGATYKHLMVNGSSTPYVEQYSYQQALVMQGKLDEALESFEAVIAEKPGEVDPRMRAAELYDREKKNAIRAAELFRDVQRIETCPAGTFIYATNRLVDLYTGPLNQPGKALGELRKLIDKYPGTPAAEQARVGLATLKARHVTPS
jgi:hypothetical protein